ncbi:MAG: hypothetical protein M1819_003192 [Sarea resinae]|nr:MAG: hypothetical protein M1819_003192 [Sarea resinae]
MASSRIVELANLISTNTKKIDEYLRSQGKPSPSFDIDIPVDLGLPVESEIDQTRLDAIQASVELQDLLQGPLSLVCPTTYNLTALELIYRLDIPSKFPIGEEISYPRLAELCGLYEPNLRRILRHGMAYHHAFCEPRKGFVAHTAASRLLAENSDVRDGLGVNFDGNWRMFARTVDALIQFDNSQEPNESAFNLANNTNKPVYEYLAEKPELARRFAGAMRSMQTHVAHPPIFLVEKYPWGKLGDATVVDVGGSEGHITVELAKKYPSLSFVVQDRPEVIEDAQAKGSIPSDFTDRITLMSHDFFTEQPVKADVYLFRYIFHNHSDPYALKIIKNLIPALKSGAKVLISDHVLPEPNTLPLMAERNIRGMDLLMLTMQNSRERELDEFIGLFKEADKRFEFRQIQVAEGTATATIEMVWDA